MAWINDVTAIGQEFSEYGVSVGGKEPHSIQLGNFITPTVDNFLLIQA